MQEENRKTVRVAAAVIFDGERIFATQRGHGEFKDGWEFPGGKIEDGETPEEALKREIMEELRTEIIPEQYLMTVECDYPQFHLSMDCFLCSIRDGYPVLTEHEDARWITLAEADEPDWLPADRIIIPVLKEKLKSR